MSQGRTLAGLTNIPAVSMIIYGFLCGFICISLCQSIKIKPRNMYITSTRAQFKINTHQFWNWQMCIPDRLLVVQCSLGHVIGIVFFLHNFSGTKRMCWTTGSWWSCLSLEVMRSIPAGSTIIYWFLWGFICVSLCHIIKIKPTNIYVYICISLSNAYAYAYIYVYVNVYVWDWHLSIMTMTEAF